MSTRDDARSKVIRRARDFVAATRILVHEDDNARAAWEELNDALQAHDDLAPSPALQPAMPKLSTNEALIRELRFDSPDLDTTLAILRGVDAFLSRQPAAQLAPTATLNVRREKNHPKDAAQGTAPASKCAVCQGVSSLGCSACAAPQLSVPAEPRHDWDSLPGTGWLCSRCGAQKRVYGVGELSQAFEYRHKGSRKWQHFAPACGSRPAAPPVGTSPKERP